MRRFAFAYVAILLGALDAGAQDRVETINGREVTVWAPRSSQRAPVVLFSHGYGGCPTQSVFLAKALSEAGYWVFAPRHHDARCGGRGIAGSRPEEPFRNPERWTDTTYQSRRDDMQAVERALRSDTRFRDRIDSTRLALVGHSLGGYTVLGLAGAWPSWVSRLPQAVVALSPYASPFLVSSTLGRLRVPVMFQGGTLDLGITPSLTRSGGVFESAPGPKHLVVLPRAGHLAWTDVRRDAHEPIIDYTIAFLDHYVRGAGATTLLTSGDQRAEYRYVARLGARP